MPDALILLASDAPDQPALPGTATDALAWRRLLERQGLHVELIELSAGAPSPLAACARFLARTRARRPLLLLLGHAGGGETWLQSPAGGLRASELAALLESHRPGEGCTVLIDACGAAGNLRPVDLVLGAAREGQPAEELRVDGQAHGAMSWACLRVLERWTSASAGGPALPISAESLRRQAALVLEGLGFRQRPFLHGPAEVASAPLWGEGPVLPSPLPVGLHRQWEPGTEHGFRVYELTKGGSGTDVFVIGPNYQPPTGWLAGREYWVQLPSDGAILKVKGGGVPTNPPSLNYAHFAFQPNGGVQSYTLTPSGSLQVLKITADGATIGYLTIGGGSPPALTWYMTTNPLTSYFPVPTNGVSFSKVESAVTITAQKRP